MVREHTVGLQELAASDICAQCFQDISSIEAAHTVAGVHNNAEALERMMVIVVGIDLFLDPLTQDTGIVGHKIIFHDSAGLALFGSGVLLCKFEDRGDVLALQTAFTGEELETVSVVGMVTGSDLHGTVTAQLNGGHKHSGGRSEIAVYNENACLEECLFDHLSNLRTGYS